MKTNKSIKKDSSYYLIIFLPVFISMFLCKCQPDNNNLDKADVEDRTSVRKTLVLSDNWRFQLDIRNIGEKERWFDKDLDDWRLVTVPMAWDCFDDALWEYEGIGWYTTTISPDTFLTGEKTEIVFGRVMYYTKVWLNGEFIGENIGGYLPFRFDITKYYKYGQENKIVVRVDNKPRIDWLPAAKQIEWIQYGGILEPVKLISKSHTFIDDLIITTIPGNNGARINCTASMVNETDLANEMELNIRITGSKCNLNKSVKFLCKPKETIKVNVDLMMDSFDLWTPDTPVLYYATANLIKNNLVIDNLFDRFGIRQLSIDGYSILLNGEPVYIKGVHRYDAYDRFGPNPPEMLVRNELALMKKAGINTIRVHYPASPEMLNLFDEYGFMLMEEIPLNWWGQQGWKRLKSIGEAEQSLDILDQAKSTLTNMIRRDKNHPCIIIWSMANECITNNEVGIKVMRELLKLTKSLDPGRLATFVAGDNPTRHLGFDEADIVCFNKYVGCNHINQIDSVVYQPLVQDLTNYRNYFGTKPIIISEFGREGIKDIHGDASFTEEFQAAYIQSFWNAIKDNSTISGGILWTWADYFHRKQFITYASYGPYGVVTSDRKQKKSLETLNRIYGGTLFEN